MLSPRCYLSEVRTKLICDCDIAAKTEISKKWKSNEVIIRSVHEIWVFSCSCIIKRVSQLNDNPSSSIICSLFCVNVTGCRRVTATCKWSLRLTKMIANSRICSTISVIKQLRRQSSSGTAVDIKSMIRVNLAGETGADKIYAGQLAVLGIAKLSLLSLKFRSRYIFYVSKTVTRILSHFSEVSLRFGIILLFIPLTALLT